MIIGLLGFPRPFLEKFEDGLDVASFDQFLGAVPVQVWVLELVPAQAFILGPLEGVARFFQDVVFGHSGIIVPESVQHFLFDVDAVVFEELDRVVEVPALVESFDQKVSTDWVLESDSVFVPVEECGAGPETFSARV